uniref:Bm7169, isoform g n=2 Tax=Brugia malayi TaxID=6279 RepID=A0A1U7F2L2_BRUMA|nr:Bm7169, isoform g [Brugia malayi]
MTDSVSATNRYEQSQQEMESGEVEIVDSGRVIDELDEALMQIGDATGSEQQYDERMHQQRKQGDTVQQDVGLHMNVSEEVIVETEESHPAMSPTPGSDVGDMEECINDEDGLYSDDEDHSDMFADREVDQVIRDPVTGEISLTMDLEDLVSRTITFDNGERIILCFSKRCRPQIAWNGHLYVAASDLSEVSYTKWRCVNEGCPGALRTSPGLTELRSSGHHHLTTCKPDDLRVRLRIVIYDLRLMAEFTDDPLEDLYSHFVEKLAAENPDVLALFPPLDTLVKRLTKHREYKVYRRRFEYEKIMAERRRGLHSKDSDCTPGMLRRMRPFPPSVCIECGISIVTDADTTSQENFVDHVSQDHQREATCQYYSFPGVHLFEQWMRELQQRSRYKIRRFSMHNESLFFLCAADDRWCRTYGVNSDGLHCTAFVRVYDYRRVSRQETRVLRIQYCLDHNFHSDEDATVDAPFTPEVFMHEVEERRLRTAGMVKSHAQRARLLRRRGEMGSEIMSENGGVWSEEGVREDDSNLQELDTYASDVAKRTTHIRNDDSASVVEFAEGPDTEHDGQEDTVGGEGERNVGYGIEGSEEGVGQEEQLGDNAASKLKRVNLQRPRFMGRTVKSDYDEKREVANLVEQCNRRVSESRSIRSIESREIQSGSGQPHYVTHRSNFSSYTLYNLVMQIELQCELFKERAQSLKHIVAAKKYLKYLTSLCDNIATDPECNKPVEELAAEIFDLKEIVNSGIVVTKQTSLLPTLSFGSGDEGSNSLQQRDGKSESETQPLIFLPVVPARSTSEELEKRTVDEEAGLDVTEQSEIADSQPNLRRSKRGKGKDETDTSFEIKKGRKAPLITISKADTSIREPYQTRRSRGVVKPNTKGVFDKSTYVGGMEATSAEGDEAMKSVESREAYTLRRIPFSGQNSKLKLAGRTMQLDAELEEVTGKPMTLRTATGNLVTVMRRFDGRLIMVSPRVLVQKESKTPTIEETQRETRSKSTRNAALGKKVPKAEQIKEEEEEEEGKETKSQRTTRSSEKRSVYSKYLKKDKDRRDEKSANSNLSERGKGKDVDNEKTSLEEAESVKQETTQEVETSSRKFVRKQLSENDVIVMDDETFSAVVKDISMESPDCVSGSESRRSRSKKKDDEEPTGLVTNAFRANKTGESKK